jgi:hypothetical protein
MWLYLFRDDEWLAVEHPFLDFARLRRPRIAFDQFGLSFEYRIGAPLRSGRLRVAATARVVSGGRAGRTVPVAVDLAVEAAGVPHTTGPSDRPGHMSEAYDASRFEQPITLDGTITVGDDTRAFVGRGERDHSWGPRYWQMEWSFLVLNGAERRLQCVEVRFPGDGTIETGALQDATGAHELTSVKLVVERDLDLARAARGTCDVTAADGTTLSFAYEAITSHEMDLSHVIEPVPPVSIYRRSLIRATPTDGGEPLLGWLEDHTLPAGVGG